MNFLERNLEDIIYENSLTKDGREKLRERGLVVEGKMFRQVDLGGFGRIDLLERGFYMSRKGFLVPYSIIYELKRNAISEDTIMQACRYVCGIKSNLSNYSSEEASKKRGNPVIWIRLIGETCNYNGGFRYLYSCVNNIDAYTFSYDIDGIHFKPIETDAEMGFCDILHSDEFAEWFGKPSFSEIRDMLEPLRNERQF